MRIFLIGFMGSGKTTLGIALAAKLRMPFVDLDALIESRENCKITQIFAEVGETGFRIIEQKHLTTLRRYRRAVIATGGGTPCFFENMDFMNKYGTTIFLKTPSQTLYNRLLQQVKKRPILRRFAADELAEGIAEMLMERQSCYEKSSLICEMDGNFQRDIEILGRAVWNLKRT